MRDAIHSVDPAKNDWKRRVSEFAGSEMFDRLFRDGMGLVEQAASYLDGAGRIESRKLNRDLALVYAAESMEVTTRLMQAASWLVVQRAVREKDMKIEEAGDEKYRLSKPSAPHLTDEARLPPELRDLIVKSRSLYERVWRLDEALYSEEAPTADNPVMRQMNRLRSAAESGAFDPLAIWRDK